VADLLIGYDPLNSLVTDFVQITDSGGNSIVKIDADGAGTAYSFTQIAVLTGVTGLTDEQAQVAAGHLIVS